MTAESAQRRKAPMSPDPFPRSGDEISLNMVSTFPYNLINQQCLFPLWYCWQLLLPRAGNVILVFVL